MTRIRRQTCTAGNAIGQRGTHTRKSQLPASADRRRVAKNFTNFWRRSRQGGGGRKEAGKGGGAEGNITGELGNRNRCHRHAAGKGRGRRFVEMEKHSFSQKEGGEKAFNDG